MEIKKMQEISPEEYQRWLSKVKRNGRELQNAPEALQADKKIVLTAVRNSGVALNFASPELKNDMEVVLAAIRKFFAALQYASEECRGDGNVVMTAIQQNNGASAFLSATAELRNDKEYVMMIVEQNGMVLENVPDHLKKDKEVVRLAVQNAGTALKFATKDLQNDKSIVLVAITQIGRAIQWASPELRNDKEVIIAAVQQNMDAMKWASPRLQNDEEIAFAAVQHFGAPVTDDEDMDARDVLYKHYLTKLQKTGRKLQDVPSGLEQFRNLVIAAVQKDGVALQFAPPELQNDKEIAMLAVKQNGRAIRYASPSIKKDKDVALAALARNSDNIRYLHEEIKRDRDVMIAAGMFDEGHDEDDGHEGRKRITLSTRFSLAPESYSEATKFTKMLKEHPYIQTGNFKLYAPNAFDKKTCDPNWTDFEHPCRGTKDTCRWSNNVVSNSNRPTDDCCWRFSFRYQLEEAKKSGGFMLQLVEPDPRGYQNIRFPKLGKGQQIELDMAETLQMKVFHVYKPLVNEKYYNMGFKKQHIDKVASVIKQWQDDDCQDMSLCEIRQTY